jgi:hypothetical protein
MRTGDVSKYQSGDTETIQHTAADFQSWDGPRRNIPMSILQTVWTDLPALIRLLERDALALTATAATEARKWGI